MDRCYKISLFWGVHIKLHCISCYHSSNTRWKMKGKVSRLLHACTLYMCMLYMCMLHARTFNEVLRSSFFGLPSSSSLSQSSVTVLSLYQPWDSSATSDTLGPWWMCACVCVRVWVSEWARKWARKWVCTCVSVCVYVSKFSPWSL